ncbi:glycosyltransferase, partial [Paraburkholderia xenovorans]
MIGVIVPAHNEEALLAPCLAALIEASRHAELARETVRIVVVLDDCDDFTGAIARAYGV